MRDFFFSFLQVLSSVGLLCIPGIGKLALNVSRTKQGLQSFACYSH